MPDRYLSWTASGPGRFVAARLGLPRPEPLRRRQDGGPDVPGPVLVGPAHSGPAHADPASAGPADGGRLAGTVRALLAEWKVETPEATERPAALVLDATGITTSERLHELYAFLHPRIRSLAPNGRVVVLGTPPELATDSREAAAQRALEGFVRSVGKELRRGATAHLLLIAPDVPDAEAQLAAPLRFALSPRSAYVSGQALRIVAAPTPGFSFERPLAGRVALVTGASRGIGATVAQTLAVDGATVVCLDVPAQGAELRALVARLGAGSAETLEADLTAADAPQHVVDHLTQHHGGVDIVVHNAGVTRDRTLGRMEPGQWDAVVAVNLTAVERLNEALLAAPLGASAANGAALNDGGRIICTSSISGIAGNVGQTNYAASKAGLIGLVQALAREEGVAGRGITVNAVAPGFIETQMTAAVPLFIREAGRRLNSLKQGGQPVDVAEAVAFLASPGAAGITGQVLRVCGQALLGA